MEILKNKFKSKKDSSWNQLLNNKIIINYNYYKLLKENLYGYKEINSVLENWKKIKLINYSNLNEKEHIYNINNSFSHNNKKLIKEILNNNLFNKIDKKLNNNLFDKKNSIVQNTNNILIYNKNLIDLHKLNNENKKLFNKKIINQEDINEDDKFRPKGNNFYYSIFTKVLNNIKSNKKIDYIVLNNKTNKKQKLKRKKRNIYQKEYLENYYKKYPVRWNHNTLYKLSLKLNLTKKNIYKWNYDKFNNRFVK